MTVPSATTRPVTSRPLTFQTQNGASFNGANYHLDKNNPNMIVDKSGHKYQVDSFQPKSLFFIPMGPRQTVTTLLGSDGKPTNVKTGFSAGGILFNQDRGKDARILKEGEMTNVETARKNQEENNADLMIGLSTEAAGLVGEIAGGPVGSALLSAGTNALTQQIFKHHIDGKEVLKTGVFNAVGGEFLLGGAEGFGKFGLKTLGKVETGIFRRTTPEIAKATEKTLAKSGKLIENAGNSLASKLPQRVQNLGSKANEYIRLNIRRSEEKAAKEAIKKATTQEEKEAIKATQKAVKNTVKKTNGKDVQLLTQKARVKVGEIAKSSNNLNVRKAIVAEGKRATTAAIRQKRTSLITKGVHLATMGAVPLALAGKASSGAMTQYGKLNPEQVGINQADLNTVNLAKKAHNLSPISKEDYRADKTNSSDQYRELASDERKQLAEAKNQKPGNQPEQATQPGTKQTAQKPVKPNKRA